MPDSDRDIFPRDGAGHTLIPAKRIEYSSLLSLLVSFNYEPLLVDDDGNDLSDIFSVWLDPDREIGTELYRTPHPDVLLIGKYLCKVRCSFPLLSCLTRNVFSSHAEGEKSTRESLFCALETISSYSSEVVGELPSDLA